MDRRTFFKQSTVAATSVALLPGSLKAKPEKAAAPASSGTSGARPSGTGSDELGSDLRATGPFVGMTILF